MRKLTLTIGFMVLLAATAVQASVIDAPHNETNNVSCSSCHTYSLWWDFSPMDQLAKDIYDDKVNSVCMTCHASGSNFPVAGTHSTAVMQITSNYHGGTWGVGCTDCHDPHYQEQIDWRPDSYVIEGVMDGNVTTGSTVIDGVTYDTSTITVKSITKDNPEWPAEGATAADPDWAKKHALNDQAAGEPDRGLIFAVDTASPVNTYSIISATPTQITVKGIIDPATIPLTVDTDGDTTPDAATFGLLYG